MSKVVLSALKSKFSKAILESSDAYGDECITIKADKLIEVCTFLRDDKKMDFDSPVFLTCIDKLGLHAGGKRFSQEATNKNPRFEIVVQLRSFSKKHRIRIKVPLEENKLKVPSLSGLWEGFNWLERETFDMYGVEFDNHPDLRRIYMYEEFTGHPLRKDYPQDKHQPLIRREWTDE